MGCRVDLVNNISDVVVKASVKCELSVTDTTQLTPRHSTLNIQTSTSTDIEIYHQQIEPSIPLIILPLWV